MQPKGRESQVGSSPAPAGRVFLPDSHSGGCDGQNHRMDGKSHPLHSSNSSLAPGWSPGLGWAGLRLLVMGEHRLWGAEAGSPPFCLSAHPLVSDKVTPQKLSNERMSQKTRVLLFHSQRNNERIRCRQKTKQRRGKPRMEEIKGRVGNGWDSAQVHYSEETEKWLCISVPFPGLCINSWMPPALCHRGQPCRLCVWKSCGSCFCWVQPCWQGTVGQEERRSWCVCPPFCLIRFACWNFLMLAPKK